MHTFCPFSLAPHFALLGQFLHFYGVLLYVRADAIEQVVILELARLARYLDEDEVAFVEMLAKRVKGMLLRSRKSCETICSAPLPATKQLHGYLKSFMKTMLPAM